MAKLSVNVNKIATLRNARGKNNPDVVAVSRDIIGFGAHGITVHPRPDRRHITEEDVYALWELISEHNEQNEKKIEFNIEGFPSQEFMKLMQEVRPHQCTLVPDPPEVITSNAGWQLHKNRGLLKPIVQKLSSWNIRSSVFVDPFPFDDFELEALQDIRAERIELYTEAYAEAYGTDKQELITQKYKHTASQVYQKKIGVNAGHDLNLDNVQHLITSIPIISEVSIGHALICEALYKGLKQTISEYLKRVGVSQ